MRKLLAEEIECKVSRVTDKGCQILLYKTSRVDMQILDEEYTPLGWQSKYEEIKGNLYCGIAVKDAQTGEWVWKWDCGIESREDGEGNQKKGEASDAFKRAGFKWGIGRELYNSPFIWLNVETRAKIGGKGFELVNKFASYKVKKITYAGDNIDELVIVTNKGDVVFDLKSPLKAIKKESKTFDAWQDDIMACDSMQKLNAMYYQWKEDFPSGTEEYKKLSKLSSDKKIALENPSLTVEVKKV